MSFEDPSRALDRFGERKMVGSMFSASLVLSKSKEAALRFGGEVIVEAIAIGESVRFIFCLIQV